MKRNFIIGLCAIIALVILFLGIQFLKGVNVFKPSNYYTASYTNVTGLQVSAPVSVNGFKVGQVSAINYEYDNPGHVSVEMTLDKSLKIPQGTKAVIECDILGTASVTLQMATSNQYHTVGDTLIGRTATSMMDDVTESIMPVVQHLLPTADSLLVNVNTLVANPALANSITRLDAITNTLANTLSSLQHSVSTLPGVMNHVNDITVNIDSMTQNLNEITAQINDSNIRQTLENLAQLSSQLNQLASSLDSPDSSVGQLIHDPALYNNLTSAAASLDSLLVDVKKNPKRYISIKLL